MLAVFSLHKLTEALDFVKKNADYSLEPTSDGQQRQLRITGVFYSQKFASAVETQLNLRSDQCCILLCPLIGAVYVLNPNSIALACSEPVRS